MEEKEASRIWFATVFIHTKEDIKFLVCSPWICCHFGQLQHHCGLNDLCDEGFGYFELSEAFYEMVPTGHIEEIPDEGETLYAITEKGREATRIFEKQLPYPVREAAQRSALRVVPSQIRRRRASTPPSPSTARTT